MDYKHSFSMKKHLILFSLLIAGLIPSQILRGQEADTSYSIIGQLVSRMDVMGYVVDYVPSRADITLVADGDTLMTDVNGHLGGFEFFGIGSKHVTLSIVTYNAEVGDDIYHPYLGTFELRPGANVILVPLKQKRTTSSKPSSAPILTLKKNQWIYHKPDMSVRRTDFVVDMMIGLPGVDYNATKGELTISGDAVHCEEVGGAFHFWQDRDAEN